MMIIYIVLGAFAIGSSIVLASEISRVRAGKNSLF
jgi:hypothetical protein